MLNTAPVVVVGPLAGFLLDQLSLPEVLWLVPVLLAIHNVEDALLIARRLENAKLPIRLPLRAPQFVVTFFAATESQSGYWFFAVVAIQAIMFLNAFLPHIAVTFSFRRYQPGVVTTILFNIPFSLYFFRRVISSGSFSRSGLLLLVLLAPIATDVLAGCALELGNVTVGLWDKIRFPAAKME